MKQDEGDNKNFTHETNKNKKTTIEREFFVCFCAKSYGSYSALYLHARKKHGKSISMEHMKYQNHEWSGNVKNIYYEFTENICNEVVENESLVLPKVRKSPNRESSRNQLGGSYSIEKHEEVEKHEFFEKIEQIFQEYGQIKSGLNYESKSEVMIAFLEYSKKEIERQFYPSGKEKTEFDRMMDIIPNLMNNFYQEYVSKISLNEVQVICELELFSEWLYKHSYTKYLAIEQHKYEVFINKHKK